METGSLEGKFALSQGLTQIWPPPRGRGLGRIDLDSLEASLPAPPRSIYGLPNMGEQSQLQGQLGEEESVRWIVPLDYPPPPPPARRPLSGRPVHGARQGHPCPLLPGLTLHLPQPCLAGSPLGATVASEAVYLMLPRPVPAAGTDWGPGGLALLLCKSRGVGTLPCR